VVGRATFNPGWRWSKDIKPIAGTEWCEYHHLGIMLEGRMHFVTRDGMEMELEAGHLYEILPGHDASVVGDEQVVQYDFAGMRTFSPSPRPAARSARSRPGLHRHRGLTATADASARQPDSMREI
jgi:hypothetical protein